MTAAACAQPGCGGTIEDGYCTVCGIAPAPTPTPASASAPSAASGASLSRGASGSQGSAAWSTGTGTGTGSGSRHGTRGSRGGSGRSSRGALGAGLVEVPPVPARDLLWTAPCDLTAAAAAVAGYQRAINATTTREGGRR